MEKYRLAIPLIRFITVGMVALVLLVMSSDVFADGSPVLQGPDRQVQLDEQAQQLPVTDNLFLHFDASKIEGLGDGDALEEWIDLAPGLNNATVPDINCKPPRFIEDGFLGNPVVRFRSGENDCLRTANFVDDEDEEAWPSKTTIFVVSTTRSDGCQYIIDGTESDGRQALVQEGGSSRNNLTILSSNWEVHYKRNVPFSPTLTTIKFTDVGDSKVFQNGIFKAKSESSANSLSGLTIGSSFGYASSRFLDGDIAEIIIYDGLLGDEDRKAVEKSLARKYWEVDKVTLTGAEGYRMLSVPEGVYMSDFLSPIWTQGVEGSDNPDAADANVFTWDIVSTDGEAGNWKPVDDLLGELDAGTGLLVYVFEDDASKTLGEGESGAVAPVTPSLNKNPEGWSFLGNPFIRPIHFGSLDTLNLTGTVYVWDVNDEEGPYDQEDVGAGSWQTWSELPGTGDLEDGIIAPFQGFFVQNTGDGDSELTFTEASKSSGGVFMGKRVMWDHVRLELNGEGMRNSAWFSFGPNGSMDQTRGDAHQLMPLSGHYALLAGDKNDDLFDISVLPTPDEQFEIPLYVEATIPGTYTLSASHFNISSREQLYLEDRSNGRAVPIDGNLAYEFTIDGALQKSVSDPLALLKTGSLKAKKLMKKSSGDAPDFYITANTDLPLNVDPSSDVPQEFSLDQNYPNPFNPTTVISYHIPRQSHVRLTVYDLLGREISVLVDDSRAPGSYDVTWDASQLSSGVYIYRLEAGGQSFTRRMTFVK